MDAVGIHWDSSLVGVRGQKSEVRGQQKDSRPVGEFKPRILARRGPGLFHAPTPSVAAPLANISQSATAIFWISREL